MNKNAVMALDAQYYLPVFARYPIVLERGEGARMYTTTKVKNISTFGRYCCQPSKIRMILAW